MSTGRDYHCKRLEDRREEEDQTSFGNVCVEADGCQPRQRFRG